MGFTLIIDGNHLAHRCRHVFSLSNRGVDVSVTYGFLKVLYSYIDRWQPTSVIVCWDGGIPEFRRRALPTYKAHRHEGEDVLAYEDFLRQMNELTRILPLMGVVSVRQLGAEGDDLVYHASRMVTDRVVIVSGDADLLQCITKRVYVFAPARNIVYDRTIFEETYGIPIRKFLDWKALQGDNSDGIPGVPGIGEKTATKLINQYGEISGVFNAADGRSPKGRIEGKLGESIKHFGLDLLCRNIYLMALYADRVGAKNAIFEAVDGIKPCNTKKFYGYLQSNAFLSLMDGEFGRLLSHLVEPELDIYGMRMPVVGVGRFEYG